MAIASSSRLLGEIFVQEGLTTPEVVERALARAQTTGERLGEALVALGAVTEDDVLRALALQQNLPVSLARRDAVDGARAQERLGRSICASTACARSASRAAC